MAARQNPLSTSFITLAIDIGGSGIKGILLNASGQPVTERIRVVTPQPATPQAIIPLVSEIGDIFWAL